MLEQIEFDKTPSNTSVNGWTTHYSVLSSPLF